MGYLILIVISGVLGLRYFILKLNNDDLKEENHKLKISNKKLNMNSLTEDSIRNSEVYKNLYEFLQNSEIKYDTLQDKYDDICNKYSELDIANSKHVKEIDKLNRDNFGLKNKEVGSNNSLTFTKSKLNKDIDRLKQQNYKLESEKVRLSGKYEKELSNNKGIKLKYAKLLLDNRTLKEKYNDLVEDYNGIARKYNKIKGKEKKVKPVKSVKSVNTPPATKQLGVFSDPEVKFGKLDAHTEKVKKINYAAIEVEKEFKSKINENNEENITKQYEKKGETTYNIADMMSAKENSGIKSIYNEMLQNSHKLRISRKLESDTILSDISSSKEKSVDLNSKYKDKYKFDDTSTENIDDLNSKYKKTYQLTK